MIKDIFIPEKIGNYYIFPKRVIGFDVGKTHVNATQVYLKGDTITIEKFVEEKLEAGNNNNYAERVAQALKNVLASVDHYNALYSAIASSSVIFREIKLPFTVYEKINMVVNFEVEPLLPFSASDAIIDFIITKTVPEEQGAEILVAAVPKPQIAEHLQLFAAVEANLQLLTVDFFALYGMYKQIPEYAKLKDGVTLLDLGSNSTRIAYIHEGQLRFIRTLPKGIFNLAKGISSILNVQPAQVMENLIRFGLEKQDNQEYVQAVTQEFTTFWNEIQFTLNSFISQIGPQQVINTILLLGGGSEIKGLTALINNLSSISCNRFDATKLLENKNIQLKHTTTIPSSSIMSLSTALPFPITKHFNLRKNEFSIIDKPLFNKQIISAIILAIVIISSLLTHSFLQIRKLQYEVVTAEQETITALKERFKKIEGDRLDDVVDEAQKEVDQEEKLWFAFSATVRTSFLEYLLELTNKIDKEGLGFEIEKLTMTEDAITLKANVKDFESLKL
ncbi:MAG TPA: hypothetical protein ENI08_00735, partial [Candidatus Dependentiae bacterium]|nr:hypothetical protein [Candidatus Dependentiae bacterium]